MSRRPVSKLRNLNALSASISVADVARSCLSTKTRVKNDRFVHGVGAVRGARALAARQH